MRPSLYRSPNNPPRFFIFFFQVKRTKISSVLPRACIATLVAPSASAGKLFATGCQTFINTPPPQSFALKQRRRHRRIHPRSFPQKLFLYPFHHFSHLQTLAHSIRPYSVLIYLYGKITNKRRDIRNNFCGWSTCFAAVAPNAIQTLEHFGIVKENIHKILY